MSKRKGKVSNIGNAADFNNPAKTPRVQNIANDHALIESILGDFIKGK